MITQEEWMEIQLLHRQGNSIREIARKTGQSRNTVRKALRQAAPQPYKQVQRESLLDTYKPYIQERYAACELSGVRLAEEVRAMGYTGSVVTLRRFLRGLKPERIVRQELTVRFETPPGQQAQADWAYAGKFADTTGKWVGIYIFVMVLSYSRMMFVEFVTSMKIAELIACHGHAFAFFGGWTQVMLYDNMKQVRVDAQQLNALFLDFANHHGFAIKTHKPYRARTKGKVERMVSYVKDSFLNGRTFAGLEDLNAQARHWLEHTANVRVHATTGRRPVDLFPQEKLIPRTSVAAYQLAVTEQRKVSREGYVHFEGSRYSAPPKHVGQTVIVQVHEKKVVIRAGDLIVATHPQAARPGMSVAAKEHMEALWKLSLLRPMPHSPKWRMTCDSIVQAIPLSVYQEMDS